MQIAGPIENAARVERPGSGLGPIETQLLTQLDRERRRVLVLPRDWALVDAVTGNRERSRDLLHRLSRAGWLRRVRRGAYVVRARSRRADVSVLELVGELTSGPHMVSAGRALAEAGLSDQAFRLIVVLVTAQQRSWAWLGERVRYARVSPSHLWGGRERRFGAAATVIATPERAILDSLAHPRWGVSFAQGVEALDRALSRDIGLAERLALAAGRYDNALLARRCGYLVSRLTDPDTARPFLALRGSTKAVVPLRPGRAPSEGPIDSRWGIRENVSAGVLPFEQAAKSVLARAGVLL